MPINTLLRDLRQLITSSRARVAVQFNEELVLLYWNLGKRIREDLLKSERAKYGRGLVAAISEQLQVEFGAGFSARNIANMIRFAEVVPDEEILHALCAKLSWSHLRQLIYLKNPLKREFYAEICRLEGWSTRTLSDKISGMLYERTAVSRRPASTIRQEIKTLRHEDKLTPDLVFRDPYFLDFLGIKDRYMERDLEDAIIRNLEKFILELGAGFAFVARQKRITIEDEDYYLDLLFFHRGLKRLVAIELKIGAFKPADKGQMEFYLKWLERHEMQTGESTPIGLILCADKKRETIELLELDRGNIRVASYWLDLLPKKLLKKKLHEAIREASNRIEPSKP